MQVVSVFFGRIAGLFRLGPGAAAVLRGLYPLFAVFLVAAAVLLQGIVFAAHTATYTSPQNNTFVKNNTLRSFDLNFTYSSGDNITGLNISLPAPFVLDSFGDIGGAGFACSNVSASLINCTNASAGGLNPTATSAVIRVNATPRAATGPYFWVLNTTDVSGGINGSGLVTNLDADAPSVSAPIVNVSDVSRFATNIFLGASYTDAGSGILECNYNITNSTGGAVIPWTNMSAVSGGVGGTANTTITAALENAKSYSIYVNCSDQVGFVGFSPPKVLTIDNVNPSVSGASVNVSAARAGTPINVSAVVSDLNLNSSRVFVYTSSGVPFSMGSIGGGVFVAYLVVSEVGDDPSLRYNVSAFDNASNVNSSVFVTFNLDNSPPVVGVPVLNVSSPTRFNTNLFLNSSYSDGSGSGVVACSYNVTNSSGVVVPWSSMVLGGGVANATVSAVLPDGNNSVRVNCTDSVGWVGFSASTVLAVDTAPPVINIQVPAAGRNFSSFAVPLNFTVGDGVSGVSSCKYELSNSSGSFNVSLPNCQNATLSGVTEGSNSVKVWANDSVNNLGVSGLVPFTVDVTPPFVGVQSPLNATYATAVIGLNFTVWDLNGVSSCKYELKNSSGSFNVSLPNCLNATLSGVTEGSNSVKVWVNDSVNNWNVSSSVSFSVDTVPPYVSVQVPLNVTYSTTAVGLNFTSWDLGGVSSCKYEIRNSSGYFNVSLPSCLNATLSGVTEGSNGVRVWANDSVNNLNASSYVSFSVDTVFPSCSVLSGNVSYARNGSSVNFSATCSDSGSGVSSVFFNLTSLNSSVGLVRANSGGGSSYSYSVVVGASEGVRAVSVFNVSDAAGNVNLSSLPSATIIVDNINPAVSNPSINVSAARAGTPINVSVVVSDLNLNSSRVFVYNSSGVPFSMGSLGGGVFVAYLVVSEVGDDPSLRYNVSAFDNASNVNGSAFITFNLDNSVPTVNPPVLNVSSPTRFNTNLFLNSSYSDGSGSGVVACSYNVTNSSGVVVPWSSMVLGGGVANATIGVVLPDGNNSVRVNCTDSVGWAGYGSAFVLKVDATPPFVSVQAPANATYSTSGLGVNFTSWDLNGVSSCKYELKNSSGSFNVSLPNCLNATLSGVTEGSNSVKVWVNDSVNNWNVSSSVSFSVDTVPPYVSVQVPLNVTYSTTAVGLNFTSWDLGGVSSCRYELKNSSGSFNVSLPNCLNATLSGVTSGGNSVKVWVNDTAGNWNASLSVSFAVDTGFPVVVVNSPANQSWQMGTVQINYTATDPGIDRCEWRWHNSTAVWSGYAALACGVGLAFNFNTAYCADSSTANCAVEVRANDSANNVNSTEVYLKIDNTVPSVNVTQPAGGWYNGTVLVRISVNDSASGAASVVFFNGSVWASAVLEGGNSNNGVWNGTVRTNAFADGASLIISANATDLLGSNGSDVSVPTVQVDNNPPRIFKPTLNVSGLTNRNTDVFANSTFNDNGGQGVAAGSCQLYVTGATSVSPYVISNAGGASGAVNGTVSAVLNDGTNYVLINCTDQQGWVGSNSTSFVVDTFGPALAVQYPANITYATAGLGVNFTSWDLNGVSSCKYELKNSSGPFNVSLPSCLNATLSGVSEGGNSVKVWANDSAGNWNASTSVSFSVDTTPPYASVQVPLNVTYASAAIGLNFTVFDAGGISSCRYELKNLSGSFNVSLPSCLNATLSGVSEGSNVVKVWLNDSVNNWNVSSTVSFTLDTTVPSVAVQVPAQGQYFNSLAVPLNFTAFDVGGVGSCWYELANSTGVFNASLPNCLNATLSGVSEGSDSVRLWANDSVGNLNSSLAVSFVADTVFPACSAIVSNGSYVRNGDTVNFTATCTDVGVGVASVYLNLTGVNLSAIVQALPSGGSNFSAVVVVSAADGVKTLRVLNVTDAAGNANLSLSPSVAVTVDSTNPAVAALPTSYPGAQVWARYGQAITLNATVVDAPAGVAAVSLNGSLIGLGAVPLVFDGSGFVNSSVVVGNVSTGVYSLPVSAVDYSGNVNGTVALEARVDNSVPVVAPPALNVSSPTRFNTGLFLNSSYSDAGSGVLACSYNVTGPSGFEVPWSSMVLGGGVANATVSAVLPDGNNSFFVNCSDGVGLVGYSSASVLNVDTASPSIGVQFPSNATYPYAGIGLNFTVWDLNGVSSCKYELSNSSGSFNVSLPGCLNATLSGVSDGPNAVRVWANDSANNWGVSGLVPFTLDLPPVVSILSPAGGFNSSVPVVFVNVSVWDAISPLLNCTVHLDGAQVWQNSTWPSGAGMFFNSSGLSEGIHSVSAGCTDSFLNYNSVVSYFTVDLVAPVITSAYPFPARAYNGTNITIFANATSATAVNIVANVTLPSLATELVPLSFSAGFWRGTVFADGTGRYLVSLNATSAVGRSSVLSFVFTSGLGTAISYNVSNSTGGQPQVSISLVAPENNGTMNYSASANATLNVPSGLVTLRIFDTATKVSVDLPVNISGPLSFSPVLQQENASAVLSAPAYNVPLLAETILPNVTAYASSTLRFNYSGLGVPDQEAYRLRVHKCAYYNSSARACSGQWSELSSSADNSTRIVSAAADSFSTFLLSNRTQVCGNGILEPPEQCDGGGSCSPGCTIPAPSGGGGTSASSAAVVRQPERETASIASLLPGASASIAFSRYDITQVSVVALAGVANVSFSVERLDPRPSSIAAAPTAGGKVYRYLDISSSLAPGNVGKVKIKFKVGSAWISLNNFSTSTVFLSRYSNGWSKLPTVFLGSGPGYSYFESGSPGFSTFAIVGEMPPPVPVQAPEVPEPAPEGMPAPPAPARPVPLITRADIDSALRGVNAILPADKEAGRLIGLALEKLGEARSALDAGDERRALQLLGEAKAFSSEAGAIRPAFVAKYRSSFIVLLFLVAFSAVASLMMLLVRSYESARFRANVRKLADEERKMLAAEREFKVRIMRQRYADMSAPPKARGLPPPMGPLEEDALKLKESFELSRHRLEAGARQLEVSIDGLGGEKRPSEGKAAAAEGAPAEEESAAGKEGARELDRRIRQELEKLDG